MNRKSRRCMVVVAEHYSLYFSIKSAQFEWHFITYCILILIPHLRLEVSSRPHRQDLFSISVITFVQVGFCNINDYSQGTISVPVDKLLKNHSLYTQYCSIFLWRVDSGPLQHYFLLCSDYRIQTEMCRGGPPFVLEVVVKWSPSQYSYYRLDIDSEVLITLISKLLVY